MSDAPVHIDFDNVTVRYGSNIALDDISLTAQRNTILGIVGPANSGKTTFLKCINRTIDFISSAKVAGRVEIDGEDVFKIKNVYGLRRRIGMVFPLPVGLPLSVYENVAYAPRRAGIHDKDTLDELVERCLKQAVLWDEVKDRMEEDAYSLSGGQQQRLCIARALATKPSILLMDEPTSALDPIATAKIEELIQVIKEKVTVIIVTHSMSQAARISDQTAFLYLGELIEAGPTKKIFSEPEQELTGQYITGRFG